MTVAQGNTSKGKCNEIYEILETLLRYSSPKIPHFCICDWTAGCDQTDGRIEENTEYVEIF